MQNLVILKPSISNVSDDKRFMRRPGRTQRSCAGGVAPSSGGWQERVLVVFLLIPLLVVSCAAVPKSEHDTVVQPESVPLPSPAYYHFLQGYLAELANDVSKAVAEYRAALHFDPKSAFLRVRLAALRFLSGNMPKAMAMLDQIESAQVREADVLVEMAKIYAGGGQFDRALGLYDEAVRLNPERGETYFDKGVLLLNLKRPQQAETVFTQGLEHAPESHFGHFYQGKALEAQEKRMEAKEAYRQAINRAKRFEPAYQALLKLHELDEDLQAAIQLYHEFEVSVTPRDNTFRKDFVRFLVKQKDYGQALGILEQMIVDEPQDVKVQIQRALVYVEMKEPHRAVTELEGILQAHPSELRVRDYLGWLYEQIDDVEKALDAYRANIDLDVTFYDSRIHLGILLYRLTRYEEAVQHLTQAAGLKPSNSETHLLLGLSYLQANKFERATDAFEKGLEYHPNDENLRFNLGAAYDKLDRFPDVVREMEAVLALNPDHTDALNYLGYSYADRGIKGEEAVELTRRAVALKPDNGAYVDSLGWALFKVGKVAEALRELQRAAELVEDDPVIFEHLGEIYLIQEHRDAAKAAWIRALQLDPHNEKLIKRFREVGFGGQRDGGQAQGPAPTNNTGSPSP
ncbi:MAG: tetratricopeptide repeat protein [Nitrospira sp.]|nr:tetratricopeptide repeat protein [Nitrospira sp.]